MTIALLKERLKQLVREKGIEQQDIAYDLGMKPPTFKGYVSGSRSPSIEKLVAMAEYFDVSLDYLVGYSDIRNPYLAHLTEEERDFVANPSNKPFIELAMEIKERAAAAESGNASWG